MTTPQQASEKEAALTHYSDMARVARLEVVNAELNAELVAALKDALLVLDSFRRIVRFGEIELQLIKQARAVLAKAEAK